MEPTRDETMPTFLVEDARMLGRSAWVRRKGPKVLTAKVSWKTEMLLVERLSSAEATPAMFRRRSIGSMELLSPLLLRDVLNCSIEEGEVTSRRAVRAFGERAWRPLPSLRSTA